MSVNHLTAIEKPIDGDIANVGVTWGAEFDSLVIEINTDKSPFYLTESELVRCLYFMDRLKEIKKDMDYDRET